MSKYLVLRISVGPTEILPLQGVSGNTSVKVSDWEHEPQTGSLFLTGGKALDFMKDYMTVIYRILRRIAEENTTDLTRDLIFLKFQKENNIYHAPLFFGIDSAAPQTEFSECINKWAQIARNPQ